MLLVLTILLVFVGAVSLVIGFVSQNTVPIYISIVCSVGAGLVLLVFSRMNRRKATAPVGAAPAASRGATTTEVLEEARSASRPSASPAPPADDFPIEDYDQLLVSEIVPLLPELDIEELDDVRAREEGGKARASILRRIDALAAELEGGGVAVAGADFDEDEDEEGDAVETTASYAAVDDEEGDDEFFPIADYDDLRANQILPLLPELDDDELAMVAARERAGASRGSILDRVDDLLGVTVAPVRTVKKAPARRAGGAQKTQKPAAKKSTAKKAAPKKTTAKKAAAKKTTAKKAPAKKAAAAKKS